MQYSVLCFPSGSDASWIAACRLNQIQEIDRRHIECFSEGCNIVAMFLASPKAMDQYNGLRILLLEVLAMLILCSFQFH